MTHASASPKLLGIAASLRNARWGAGNKDLIESLKGIKTEKELNEYLTDQSEMQLSNFIEAGRKDGKPFLEIYKNLKSKSGDKGLSNSEVALAAALWAAHQKGSDIAHLSLAEFFDSAGNSKNIDELKNQLKQADGILISGPVYFGDRGSLAHELVELIRKDPELTECLKGKLYGGIAVGAKRNGGQETTLVYQMLDFISMGLLAVGNDSDTTSQYGGTGLAGDVGTMHKDSYGLNTSMGTGRRMASIIKKAQHSRSLSGPVKILFAVLQDSQGFAVEQIKKLVATCGYEISPVILDIANKKIIRCIACDICPIDIDVDEIYRCIINSTKDDFEGLHEDLLGHDAIIPVTVSLKDRSSLVSNYQTFIERTRYLRRGDYVFSDWLTAPLSFEEIGVNENYSIRMMTSMIRHHTVMAKPMKGHIFQSKILNWDQLVLDFRQFTEETRNLTTARLAEVDEKETTQYNPVGYILSADKDKEDERLKKRQGMTKSRNDNQMLEASKRLEPIKVHY
jgi:multimeric flavodoxin WrbA